jgi:hypothetical protein
MATILFWEVATLTPAGTLFKICRTVQLDQALPDFNGKGRREAAPSYSQPFVAARAKSLQIEAICALAF